MIRKSMTDINSIESDLFDVVKPIKRINDDGDKFIFINEINKYFKPSYIHSMSLKNSIDAKKEENKEEVKREEEEKKEIDEERKITTEMNNMNNLNDKLKIITDNTCKIQLPDNYYANDEDEKKLVDIFNGKGEQNFKMALNRKGIIIYKNIFEDGSFMLMTIGTLHFPFNTVVNAFHNLEIRKKWDTVFKKIILVESSKKENITTDIVYFELKFPLIMSNRDYVQQKRFYENYGGDPNKALFHFKSVEHKDYPETQKIVRAIMFLGGYYFEAIKENETKVLIINHTDVKLKKEFASMANSKGPQGAYEFIERLIKGCKMASN